MAGKTAGSVDRYIIFQVHYELADGVPSWWAESDDLPGWSGCAPTRDELLTLTFEAIDFLGITISGLQWLYDEAASKENW